MKEKVITFLKEIIVYMVILLIILLVADKKGWTTTSVLDNLIGLTIGWLIWRLITFILEKKRNK